MKTNRLSRGIAFIEARLRSVYDLPGPTRAAGFLCDREKAARYVGEEVARGEVLILHQRPDETLEVGLFLCPEALEAAANHASGQVVSRACLALAIEGVSHLLFVEFQATHARPTSLLELEVQAEVDKFVLTWSDLAAQESLQGWGVGAFRHTLRAAQEMTFDAPIAYIDGEDTEEGRRYREATRVARNLSAHMAMAHGPRDPSAAINQLRKFYRASLQEKRRFSDFLR